MAKVSGIISIQGNIGDFVFYKLNGQNVCRSKDTGQSERLKSDPRYANCRVTSTLFTEANTIATAIYRLAKCTEVRLDYLQHGKLVKLVFRFLKHHLLPDGTYDFAELMGSLKGFCFNDILVKIETNSKTVTGCFDGDMDLSNEVIDGFDVVVFLDDDGMVLVG
jgi:hypothetical protein